MAALVSPIVDIILRLWTCCARHTRYLRKLQRNKNLLSTTMDELKEARDDVQRRVVQAEADPNEPKKRTEQVRGWLQRVELIEGEVVEILQEVDEQLSRARCLGGCCPPNNCWSNYKVGKSIAKKIPFVDELKGKAHFEEVAYKLPPPYVQDINLESTVGMETLFNEVWRIITSTDDKFSIIGLYGQGGVGKTTLLKQINNEFKRSNSEHNFDHIVIFVVVSRPINYNGIQTTIGERLGLSDSLQRDGDEEKSRAQKILNGLTNKNYVLLLDDIWEKVDLQRIGIPIHPKGNSKLIFTTRSEKVCGDMKADKNFKVHCLPWDEAWRLFKENVGEEALNYFPGACGLAELVAKECDGLPLALTTLGRAMCTKRSVEEWKDAITTLKNYASEFEGMSNEVLPRLKPSYDYLRNNTIKSCFRYCALYPEDYSIEIAKLVDLWIAEGILHGFDKLDEARNRGHTIIGSLKSACLLESSDELLRQKTHVKMHDVIRDLALWIVNDCRSSDESRNNSDNKYLVAINDPCKKWENAERIFWDATHYTTSSSSNNEKEENPPTSLNLLTLIVKTRPIRNDYRWPQSFFQHMPLLRVLDLSNTYLDTIPISICELHELQYLNLSGTGSTEFSVELKKLVKLKFLILKNFRRIPARQIANLFELQVLDLRSYVLANWELEDGPSFSELDGMEQLQEVRISITTDVAFDKFLCNRKLQMVCTDLTFMISSSSSSSRVLDLSNFKSLKDLVLDGRFTKGGFSDLLRSHSQSLHEIYIDECDAIKDLTWLVYAENLKTLHVWECKGLETIIEFGGDGLEAGAEGGDQILLNTGGGGGGGGGGVFRRLRILDLKWLPNLKSICGHALAFPSIQTISIFGCPELKRLPLGSGSNINNTLKGIIGRQEWWNELQWEDETIKSKFLPYLNKGY